MALIGFARVSTIEQDLTNQIEQLEKAGCEKIFQGKNSGKKESNEARLKELLAYARDGDVVVTTKLDRLGRSTVQVLSTIDYFRMNGIGFRTLDGQIDTTKENDPMAMAMVSLLAVFAELERNLIRTRTIEGKQAKGMLQGRPEALSDEQYKQFAKDVKGGLSLSALQKKYGIGRATVSRWKQKVRENL